MNCPTCNEATEPLVNYQSARTAADTGYVCVNRHRWETVPGGIVLPLPNASAGVALSVNKTSLVAAADGKAFGTVTVTDPRGGSASGKFVKLRIPVGGSASVDADCFSLDIHGMATALFQPTTVYTGELTFEFFYENGEADPVTFTVRRGT